MTHQKLEYFRALILRKRAELLKDLGQIEEQSINATAPESSGGLSYSDHMPDLGSDAMEREKAFMFACRDGTYLAHLDQIYPPNQRQRLTVAPGDSGTSGAAPQISLLYVKRTRVRSR